MKLSDEELIELYRKNMDKEFLGAIYNRYVHLIYGVCLKYFKDRETSRDAVMDIFEGLFEKVLKQEIRDFSKWVYVVAKNHCLMKLRKKGPITDSENNIELFMESGDSLHLNSEDLFSESNLERLERAIKELPDEQMKCIQLFYLQEKSYDEIIDLTGYEFKQVKSYIQNGKRNLKIWFEKQIE